jgi:hypothetical protein
MIFLQDDDSKQQFMVDTGAVCSVLPHRSNAQPAGPQLSGTNGRSIPTWGTIRRRLSFGLRTFFVTFLLAAVYRPILGLDFLSAHGLLVDPVGRQVLDSKTLKPLSKPSTAAGTLRSKFAADLCSIAPSVRSLLASVPAAHAAVPAAHAAVPAAPAAVPAAHAAVPAAHYAAMATHTTVTAAHIADKTAHDPASATNTHDNGRPRRSGHRHRRRRTIAHRSYGFRSRLVHTCLARYIKLTTT